MSRTYTKRPLRDTCWFFRDQVPWRRHYKPYYKPSKWFKKLRAARFRAQEKDAFRKGKELPVDKKIDIWDWS